jgi:DNA-binding transcriptional regulator YdaS (Cro superfamily)
MQTFIKYSIFYERKEIIMKPMDLLKIEFGSLRNLAEALQLRPNTVVLWGQTQIPFKYIKEIERLSENRVTREMLRPDVFNKE